MNARLIRMCENDAGEISEIFQSDRDVLEMFQRNRCLQGPQRNRCLQGPQRNRCLAH